MLFRGIAVAESAQADLDKALPALNAAVQSLSALNKGDITEIKSFSKPPPLVQTTMEAVCTLLGEKPDWDTAKKVLGDSQFMKRLIDFDKDNIEVKIIKKLEKYTQDIAYTPEAVGKVSSAARSLCMWTHAMDVYSKVCFFQIAFPRSLYAHPWVSMSLPQYVSWLSKVDCKYV